MTDQANQKEQAPRPAGDARPAPEPPAKKSKLFTQLPDRAEVCPFDNDTYYGLSVHWALGGVGCGELVFCVTKATGAVTLDRECMNDETCAKIIATLRDHGTLVREHGFVETSPGLMLPATVVAREATPPAAPPECARPACGWQGVELKVWNALLDSFTHMTLSEADEATPGVTAIVRRVVARAAPPEGQEPPDYALIVQTDNALGRIRCEVLDTLGPDFLGQLDDAVTNLLRSITPAPARAATPPEPMAVLAWLGEWRDTMPAEAVTALQDICGGTTGEAQPAERPIVLANGRECPHVEFMALKGQPETARCVDCGAPPIGDYETITIRYRGATRPTSPEPASCILHPSLGTAGEARPSERWAGEPERAIYGVRLESIDDDGMIVLCDEVGSFSVWRERFAATRPTPPPQEPKA